MFIRWEELGGTEGTTVPVKKVIDIPELINNPLKYRIGKVFGKTALANAIIDPNAPKAKAKDRRRLSAVQIQELDKQVCSELVMHWSDFLYMANAFCPHCDFNTKARVAFQVYDMGGDELIDKHDIEEVMRLIVPHGSMTDEQIKHAAHEVLSEADDDGNNVISHFEFKRILMRCPDFMSRFQFEMYFPPKRWSCSSD